MYIIVVSFVENHEKKILDFVTTEEFFKWLQEYWDDNDILPEDLMVFKAFQLFDMTK